MTLRIGLVGLGDIHPVHADALARVTDIEVVAAYDPRPDAVCHSPGAHRAPSLRALLEREDLDAVLVAAPTLKHFEITREILEAGHHVLVEKPVTVNLAEFEALYEIADRNGRICFAMLHDSVGDEIVHFQERLYPKLSAALGRLTAVRSTYFDAYVARGELEMRRPGLMGSWVDSASNSLSVVCCFADRLEVVSAEILLDGPGSPDREDVDARVAFTGAAVGTDGSHPVEVTVATSWLEDRYSKATRLEYEGGAVVLEHDTRLITLDLPGSPTEVVSAVTELERLRAQYVRVFHDYARLAAAGADNREFARSIHRPLLSIYDGGRLTRRYRLA
jgi:predicted dehydrogenase